MCNFCPIYDKLDFASDFRESRISICKKFLSAVPQLLSADDEVREAGDVTFHCEHPQTVQSEHTGHFLCEGDRTA